MLIIEIAAGIILGFILLHILPEILGVIVAFIGEFVIPIAITGIMLSLVFGALYLGFLWLKTLFPESYGMTTGIIMSCIFIGLMIYGIVSDKPNKQF